MSRGKTDVFLTKEQIAEIQKKISDIEKETSGEIVVSIKKKLNFIEKKKTVVELAKKEFRRIKIAVNENSSGILIFIVPKRREFCFLPDNKILSLLKEDFLQTLVEDMKRKFNERRYFDGIIDSIEEIGKYLRLKLPSKPDDKNDLPNEIQFN